MAYVKRIAVCAIALTAAAAVGGDDLAPTLAPPLEPIAISVVAPNPEPELPPEADPFDPPSRAVTSGAPVVAEGLRAAEPGEVVPLAGDFPDGVFFEVFAQTAESRSPPEKVEPLRAGATTAVLKLPGSLPPRAMTLIWPRLGARVGKPFAVNRTESWWLGPDSVVAGASFTILGRNFEGGSRGGPFVYLKAISGAGRWLRPSSSNRYRIDVQLPKVALGSYEVWTHNGRGGRYGWSGPLRLTITDQQRVSETTVNVRAFGAKGDGVTDDGEAIMRAAAAARHAAPASLYFPEGRYVVRRVFRTPSRVRWRGEGKNASFLRFAVPLAVVGYDGFLRCDDGCSDIAFENMTISGDGQIAGEGPALIAISGERVSIRDARLTSWGGHTLKMNVRGLQISSSDLRGAGSFLGASSKVTITGSTFLMTNDGEAALTSWGGEELSVTENRMLNADPSRQDGFGIGRFFVAQGHFGSLRHAYFGANETFDSAPRHCVLVDCNKGEQFLFEITGNLLRGPPTAVGASTVTHSNLDGAAIGLSVVVIAGEGLGQRRRITQVNGGVATLDRPWDVTPEPRSSVIEVGSIVERIVVLGNRLQGRASHSSRDSNSTGALLYGRCYDIVIARNIVSRMRHGVMAVGTSALVPGAVFAPFFNLVENNRISDVFNGIYVGAMFGLDAEPRSAGGVGNVFRQNEIQSVSHVGVAFDTWGSGGGDHYATVFERNTVRDAPFGLVSGLELVWSRAAFRPTPREGTRLFQIVLHRNRFERGAAPREGSIGWRTDSFQDWVNVDSVWGGFATDVVRDGAGQ